MAAVCEICGNDKLTGTLKCPFCGSKYEHPEKKNIHQGEHRVINIEIGKPTVDVALRKLDIELERARQDSLAAVTIIHGYGASGRGGAIRIECRKALAYLREKKKIRSFIPGERFSRKEGQTRTLLRRLPKLGQNENLNRRNKGVTVVEL